ncbi:MAG: hypothetical protein PHT84_05740 [Candidatus Pacebacteria bacterium]|jgi:hypothetical protein|nr:hypothetical protein [Candidatus Paceibacterota bacterium]
MINNSLTFEFRAFYGLKYGGVLLKLTREKIISTFNTKNYRNSPIIREFYRFVAKNGLREEAFKMLNNISGSSRKKVDYLSKLYH